MGSGKLFRYNNVVRHGPASSGGANCLCNPQSFRCLRVMCVRARDCVRMWRAIVLACARCRARVPMLGCAGARFSAAQEQSQVALAEQAIAGYTGFKYAVGFNSCGSAIFVSLLSCGVQPGDKVRVCVRHVFVLRALYLISAWASLARLSRIPISCFRCCAMHLHLRQFRVQ
jgi:hypothetical protein